MPTIKFERPSRQCRTTNIMPLIVEDNAIPKPIKPIVLKELIFLYDFSENRLTSLMLYINPSVKKK